MVYVGALALLDFLSGSVTGPWVINNYVECGMGEDDSPVLDKTRFAAISAEFTICTANFISLLKDYLQWLVPFCTDESPA